MQLHAALPPRVVGAPAVRLGFGDCLVGTPERIVTNQGGLNAVRRSAEIPVRRYGETPLHCRANQRRVRDGQTIPVSSDLTTDHSQGKR